MKSLHPTLNLHNSALIRPLEELLVVIASIFIFVFVFVFFIRPLEELLVVIGAANLRRRGRPGPGPTFKKPMTRGAANVVLERELQVVLEWC